MRPDAALQWAKLKKLMIFFVALAVFHGARSNQAVLVALPDAAVVGRGIYTYLFLDIYEATLYAPGGIWNPATPHALSLEYSRTIDAEAIVERSVQEMRKQGFADEAKLAAWAVQMREIFPDVRRNTVLSAVYIPGGKTTFYEGDREIGVIEDGEFGKRFLGIWLNDKTSAPALRRSLLGQS